MFESFDREYIQRLFPFGKDKEEESRSKLAVAAAADAAVALGPVAVVGALEGLVLLGLPPSSPSMSSSSLSLSLSQALLLSLL